MAQQATVIAPENRPGNVKFEKIWNRAKDCDVASVVLHAFGTTLVWMMEWMLHTLLQQTKLLTVVSMDAL